MISRSVGGRLIFCRARFLFLTSAKFDSTERPNILGFLSGLSVILFDQPSRAVILAFNESISANASCKAAVKSGTSFDWSIP